MQKKPFAIINSSFRILIRHPWLLFISVFNKALYFAITIWGALPAIYNQPRNWQQAIVFLQQHWPRYVIMIALFYLVNIMTTLLYAVMMSYVYNNFTDQKKFRHVFMQAAKRFPQLMLWALYRSIIGTPIKMGLFIFRYFKILNKHYIGYSWHASTYFSVLQITVDRVNALKAARRSYELIEQRWSRNVGLNISPIATIVAFAIMATLIMVGVFFMHTPSLATTTNLMIIIGLIFFYYMLEHTIAHIICPAVFYYAKHGTPPKGFEEESLAYAFRERYWY